MESESWTNYALRLLQLLSEISSCCFGACVFADDGDSIYMESGPTVERERLFSEIESLVWLDLLGPTCWLHNACMYYVNGSSMYIH